MQSHKNRAQQAQRPTQRKTMEENKQFDKKSLRYVMGTTSDFGELAKDCVAFANTNGGFLAIGIEDDADLPDAQQTIAEDLPEKVIKRINELTINVALQPEIITKEASRLSDYVAANYRLKRKSLIALGIILQKRSLSASDLTKELQLTEQDRLRTYVDTLLTNEIVITKGVGKGTKYEISPFFLTRTKVQSPTTLKTIEPHRLKALILEDLRFYPNSSIAEMATRLPDVEYAELEKTVRAMARNAEIKPIGGRKYRKYSTK